MSVWWSLKLPGAYGILAGDPASGRFAIATQGTPAPKPSAADDATSDTAATPGFVMLFGSGSCLPAAAWRCPPSTSLAALAFAQPGSEMAAKFKGVAGASPLLLLTDTRDFAILGDPIEGGVEREESEADGAASGPATAAEDAAGSALESIFGSGLSSGPAPMDVDEDGFISMDWSKLLDAPSHALPLISDLCPVILESMLLKDQQT